MAFVSPPVDCYDGLFGVLFGDVRLCGVEGLCPASSVTLPVHDKGDAFLELLDHALVTLHQSPPVRRNGEARPIWLRPRLQFEIPDCPELRELIPKFRRRRVPATRRAGARAANVVGVRVSDGPPITAVQC